MMVLSCGAVVLSVVFGWCFRLVGGFGWCFQLVLSVGILVLSVGAFGWCFQLVLSVGILVLSVGAFGWHIGAFGWCFRSVCLCFRSACSSLRYFLALLLGSRLESVRPNHIILLWCGLRAPMLSKSGELWKMRKNVKKSLLD
jgi:hypothetical protein